ncbi:hypothetical protein GCM10009745_08240 [Kribbella yunnanensis]|uniref:Uncharacterized protein n=1 Tax=Kribbella yunnanensis TaxID=190194 RepID=A0ABP4SDN7_9ACTN
MRRFELCRYRDPSDVSGTGVVALGVEFPPDHEGHQWVALKWLGIHPAMTFWPSVFDLLEIHGHLGASEVLWLDPDPLESPADSTAETSPYHQVRAAMVEAGRRPI